MSKQENLMTVGEAARLLDRSPESTAPMNAKAYSLQRSRPAEEYGSFVK
jgi:hypothetical protein